MNSRIFQSLTSARLTAALLFALLTLVMAQTPADEASATLPRSSTTTVDASNQLPDLGNPAANSGSLQPNIHAQGAGFNFRDNINGS